MPAEGPQHIDLDTEGAAVSLVGITDPLFVGLYCCCRCGTDATVNVHVKPHFTSPIDIRSNDEPIPWCTVCLCTALATSLGAAHLRAGGELADFGADG